MTFSTLFIPGYTVRNSMDYAARLTVAAAARIEGLTHHELAFPLREIGAEIVLPTFPEMVVIAQEAIRECRPSLVIGHCVGAAVALQALREAGKDYDPFASILICPPIAPISELNLFNPKFRIFGMSVGIPKKPFKSINFQTAVTCKANTVIDAARVFSDFWRPGMTVRAEDDLVFVSAQNDRLCPPATIALLAAKTNRPHVTLNDNHSIKRSPSIEIIQALIEICRKRKKSALDGSAVLPLERTSLSWTVPSHI